MEQHLKSGRAPQPQRRHWSWWLWKLLPVASFLAAGLALIVAIGLAQRLGWVSAGSRGEGAAATDAGAANQRLSIPQIHDRVEAAGYRDIRSIELESEGYEVKAFDSAGQRVKLYLDPVTGEVLEMNKKRDKRDRDARYGTQGNSRIAD